jgi:hypothetical protein
MVAINDESLRATGNLQNQIAKVGTSVPRVTSLVDSRQLEYYCRFPASQTMRQVLETLGSNVVLDEPHTSGDFKYADLRNRHTGKPFSLKLQLTEVKWHLAEERMNGAWPFGVQIACGVFEFVSGREFSKDTNRFLDLLGLKRDGNNYHYGRNIGRFNNALDFFEGLLVPHFKPDKKKRKVLDSYEPFLRQTGIPATAHSGINYRVGVDTAKGYGWLDKRWFQIDANRHRYAVLLYPYLAHQWQIGWNQHRGTFKRNLPAILRDVGISYSRKHFARTVDTLKKDVAFLRRNGLVGQYQFSTKDGRVLLSVEAPEKHPVRTLRRGGETA